MIVRKFVMAVAAVAILAPAAASAQTTEPVSFSISNESSSTITSILYGESSNEEWSDNILDEEVGPGDSVEITVDDDLADCDYDFHYEFDNGGSYTEQGVDMCELNGSEHTFEDSWDDESEGDEEEE